jgi:lysophospholipase L1-like esterase
LKKIFSVFLASLLFVAAFITPSAGAATVKLDYVALGDSIAAGQTPNKTIGTSYTDMIAAELGKQAALASFTKDFATSGETSAGFLIKLQRSDVQEAVKNAELVTISSGANDLLAFAKTGSTDPLKGLEVVSKVDQNLTASIQKVKSLNPKADIYLFGYYFPFPNMEAGKEKDNLTMAFNIFNSQLKSTAKAQSVTFVEVSSSFKAAYLPNVNDIHPNEAGYRVLADQFFKVWDGITTTPDPVTPDPVTPGPDPVTPHPGTPDPDSVTPVPGTPADPFSDMDKLGSKARIAIMKLSEAGVINGKADGTFAPQSKITRAETAIILARALNVNTTAKNPGFSDVSSGMKSYTAIAQLTEKGVFAKALKFNPDKPLTRAQMARVLVQAYDFKTVAAFEVSFKDVPANHWAQEEIHNIVGNFVMQGGTGNMFYPENSITRAEFAMSIYNIWLQHQSKLAAS